MLLNHIITSIILLSFLVSKTCYAQEVANEDKPFKIILLIGDGMGLSQLSSAYFYGEEEPSFSRFKQIALHKSRSSSHKITDSAAGATAFACGIKSYNGAIAKSDKEEPVETILEFVSELGWNTGVIATSSITHATPASFYAHVDQRSEQPEIARQLCYSEVDFFAGGGLTFFSNRLDQVNLLDTLASQDFAIDTMLPERIEDVNKKYGFILAAQGLQAKHEGRGDELMKATKLALDYFDRKQEPYFLMIESSQIDWGGHANVGDYVIEEVLEFEQVIGAVLDYAEADGNTLVIVTADHETGGFTLAGKDYTGPMEKTRQDYSKISPKFSTAGHSCALIPVFAYGPGSELIQGVIENTFVFDVMLQQAKSAR